MTQDEKSILVMESNLPDDLKVELICLLQKQKDIQYVPYPVHPKDFNNEWWKKLEVNGKPKVVPCVDDSGWIEQQRLNGIADAESIIHPNVTYNTSKNAV